VPTCFDGTDVGGAVGVVGELDDSPDGAAVGSPVGSELDGAAVGSELENPVGEPVGDFDRTVRSELDDTGVGDVEG